MNHVGRGSPPPRGRTRAPAGSSYSGPAGAFSHKKPEYGSTSLVGTNNFVEMAKAYRRNGFGIVWLEPGEKNPKILGWTTRSREPEDYTPGKNIGIMGGWVSGDLVIVDLDMMEALEVADEYLPHTGMI